MPQSISVREAAKRLSSGAVMVDVREAEEFKAVAAPGTINVPLSLIQKIGKDAYRNLGVDPEGAAAWPAAFWVATPSMSMAACWPGKRPGCRSADAGRYRLLPVRATAFQRHSTDALGGTLPLFALPEKRRCGIRDLGRLQGSRCRHR